MAYSFTKSARATPGKIKVFNFIFRKGKIIILAKNNGRPIIIRQQ